MQLVAHPELGVLNASLDPVRDDAEGQVEDVIGMMTGYVLADVNSPEIVADAGEALGEYGPNPTEAVFRYVKNKLRFVLDEESSAFTGNPDVVEVLIRPRDMSTLAGSAQGDCDDFVMYGAALLLRLGVPVSFVTIAADPRDPSRYSHVYLAAYPGGRRTPIDISHGPYPGWEAGDEKVYKRREWPVEKPSLLPMLLVIGAIYVCCRYTRDAR